MATVKKLAELDPGLFLYLKDQRSMKEGFLDRGGKVHQNI